MSLADQPPLDQQTTSQVLESEVFDAKGDKIQLGSLFDAKKTVLVFIRHFLCGMCQEYVMHLASVRKEALEQADANIIVVGCGEWDPIPTYAEITGFKGPILADPTRKLYQILGLVEHMAKKPAGVPRKSYLTSGVISNVLTSVWRGLKNPVLIGKGGNISQLGGEFVFGPDNECIFAYRMQYTEDHTEVAELMKTAGVTYP